MAVFGPPLASDRHATNAAACALEIIERVNRWNKLHARYAEPIQVAVGIHYGEVVQGDVGTDQQLEFTVVGDTVNIASRVEASCLLLDAAVLVTGDLVQALRVEGSVELAGVFADEGMHELRGRSEPIHLFSVKRGSTAYRDRIVALNPREAARSTDRDRPAEPAGRRSRSARSGLGARGGAAARAPFRLRCGRRQEMPALQSYNPRSFLTVSAASLLPRFSDEYLAGAPVQYAVINCRA